jgi:hypothetical protein
MISLDSYSASPKMHLICLNIVAAPFEVASINSDAGIHISRSYRKQKGK